MTERRTQPHPIEVESYRIMQARVDFSAWPEPARSVVARMVHSTADESFSVSTLVGFDAVPTIIAALDARSTVVCDSRMVAAGVPAVSAFTDVVCALDFDATHADADGHQRDETRSAAAISRAATAHPSGAVWVIGNAPTALARLVELARLGRVEPSGVIALPVGYVGAAEAKAELWSSPLAAISITNRGERGGSPVAAAALNSIARLRLP